jgi:acetylornithine deacetylase/succinyl-diaminopimelate desuccinylase-like protein
MDLITPTLTAQICAAVQPARLLATAVDLVAVPSPTRSAGAVADRLAALLAADGFTVARPVAGWPEAPAVVVRYDSGRPGPTLQFNGHLDTVHLPFVPPRVEEGILYGSGAADMKGGIAAAVEALRVVAEQDLLPGGSILLTAHDHHEGPWGDRRQLRALLAAGYVGDAVLLPEYLADRLPIAGRGSAIFEVTINRPGEPVHEVLRPPNTPDVIAAGADLVCRLGDYHRIISAVTAPHAGHDSVFVGHISAGAIFNQSPTTCRVSGVRRWVTPGRGPAVTEEIRGLCNEIAAAHGVSVAVEFELPGDAFRLDPHRPPVRAFQAALRAVTGAELPPGNKPFVDDGNVFSDEAGIPAITHGPNATGAHTVNEAVPVAELVRVAQVYALTAVAFCQSSS